ncbi:hypothetical protein DY000_02037143 [Brassica cretica]|uniref:Uncharacterized protein n=1 Tax=Brassica cretica TaxID=69181 RepID=A0ABQ7BKJ4_BRACR|nr:hypothetical protein DY000_02037143 [Brassica cretica]
MLSWRGINLRTSLYSGENARDKLVEQVYALSEDGHDCSMQKTIMLKDGRYGQWKVRMKLLVRGINDDAWIAVKTGWEDPTIFTAEGKKPKPKEPRQEVTGVSVMEGLTSKHLCFSLVCNQAGGEVVTFWSKECISLGGEEHGDGCLDVDGAYLMGEKVYLL